MLSFTRTLLRLSPNIQYSTYLPIKEYMDDFAMRVVFIGAEKSGTKTSFINRYVTGAFSERQERNYDAPQKKKLFLNGATINLELVDMPNIKHLGGLKLVSGIVVGYSSASRQSLSSAQGIYNNVKGMFPKAVTMVLGGAADKASSTGEGVSAEEGRSFAKSIGANLFFEGKEIKKKKKHHQQAIHFSNTRYSVLKNGRARGRIDGRPHKGGTQDQNQDQGHRPLGRGPIDVAGPCRKA